MTATDWRTALGWNEGLEQAFAPLRDKGLFEARVTLVHRKQLKVLTHDGERWAETGGRIRHHAQSMTELPAVGDWVACRASQGAGEALVSQVLPRKSAFIRKEPGHNVAAQVLCTNLDTVLVVMGLDQDFNLRRLERFLALAWESKATPVVALNKLDVCDAPGPLLEQARQVAQGAEVHTVSALTGEGLAPLASIFGPGLTVALLGSSGVGKSTLVNHVVGAEVMVTASTRDDGRGRHTTTRRELLLLPQGGSVIDTPGLREVQLWEAEGGLAKTFDDIEALGQQCRFTDCKHEAEPGCAVKAALESGALSAARYESYRQLGKELAWLAAHGRRAPLQTRRRDRVGKGKRR